MTLTSLLRANIAAFEAASKAPEGIVTPPPEETTAIVGGTSVADTSSSDTEGYEGDEGDEAAMAFISGGFACGADGGLDDGDACGADACAIDAGGANSSDDLEDVIGADLGAGVDDLDV
ncbi:hypothetical protein [Tateyamaria sp.]|uniref:hypothetical protein n=1 Tax=Tateyamaria sp. TaxID=1929288 RepID=UPI00329FA7EA